MNTSLVPFGQNLSLFDLFDPWEYSRGSAYDLVELDDKFVMSMDVPGFSKEDIDVSFKDGVLSVKAEKKETEEYEKGHFHYRRERYHGRVNQALRFTQSLIDPKKITARSEHGILKIDLPKKAESKPHTIKIE